MLDHDARNLSSEPTPDTNVPGLGLTFDEAQCWSRWRNSADTAAREQLICHYLFYARTVAATYYKRRTHDDIEFDEYLQLASVGLVEATERFDPAQGVQFKTFAARRMHGAILTGLERLTEKNQQIAVKKSLQQERLSALKNEAKSQGDSPDIGLKLDVKSTNKAAQDALFRYLAEVGIGLALGVLLDGTGMIERQDSTLTAPEACADVSYFRQTELKNLQARVRDVVARLSSQEKTVIQYHYQQEISFDEVARMMNVTKGRISQIHRQALMHLRELLTQGPHCNRAL